LTTYVTDPNAPRDLKKLIDGFDDSQRKAAQVMLGYVSQKLRSSIEAIAPEVLFPDHTSSNPLQQPSGLVYLVAEKRDT
jgi:hypothetical protein